MSGPDVHFGRFLPMAQHPSDAPVRIVSWNIAGRAKPWRELRDMDADLALLQEARGIPPKLDGPVETGGEPWTVDSHDPWPRVVRLSDRVRVKWFRPVPPRSSTHADEIAVSAIGTIAAAQVIPLNGVPPFIAVSMYARWIKPHPLVKTSWRVGYADGSAHRILSDLSAFIGNTDPASHRILAAGDLNMFYGGISDNKQSLSERDQTVFDRMEALGLEFLGPQYPAGRMADPVPPFVPEDTRNVVTYYTVRQKGPAEANRQLDYVFASRGFHQRIKVRALNEVEEWGSSDHCRIQIEVT